MHDSALRLVPSRNLTSSTAMGASDSRAASKRKVGLRTAPAILFMICALLGTSAHGQMVIPSVPGDITTTAGFWNGVSYAGPAMGAVLSPTAGT